MFSAVPGTEERGVPGGCLSGTAAGYEYEKAYITFMIRI